MLYFCSKNHLCFMIDAAALSTTKMNPPETSQSKKFRRKKRSSFQSMTFLWLSHIFFTALLLFWNWKTSLPPKKQLQGYEDWLLTIGQAAGQWTTFPMTLKLSFKVNTWLVRLQFRLPKKVIGFGCHHPTTGELMHLRIFWVLVGCY